MLGRYRIARYMLFAVFAVVAGAVLAAVSGETVIRSFQPQHDAPRYFHTGGPYQFQLKANFHQTYRFGDEGLMEVDTNSLGLRDRDWNYGAPYSGKTVVLAGDSFVFGHGVGLSERMDTFLSALLDPGGQEWRVLNTGVPGWGTIQSTRFVRDHFELLRPDVVVLVFCGNDPENDTDFLNNTGTYAGNRNVSDFPGKEFLRNHSHLYRFLLYRVRVMKHNMALRARQRRGEKLVVDTQTAEPISPEDWTRTLKTVREFHRNLLAFNPDAKLFVMASNPRQINIRRELASLDNGGSLRFIDLGLNTAGLAEQQMRLEFDQHWSPLMHQKAAEAVYEALRQ